MRSTTVLVYLLVGFAWLNSSRANDTSFKPNGRTCQSLLSWNAFTRVGMEAYIFANYTVPLRNWLKLIPSSVYNEQAMQRHMLLRLARSPEPVNEETVRKTEFLKISFATENVAPLSYPTDLYDTAETRRKYKPGAIVVLNELGLV
jgi:hypothetical protein